MGSANVLKKAVKRMAKLCLCKYLRYWYDKCLAMRLKIEVKMNESSVLCGLGAMLIIMRGLGGHAEGAWWLC